MKLIIAEKPDAAKKMAEPYGGRLNKEKGYIEVNPCSTFPTGAIFCFAIGHLVGLAPPESYKEEWKTWSLQTLPLIPETFKYEITNGKSKPFQVIRKLLQDSRIDEVIIGTDAGREGEAIAWYILKKSGITNIEHSRVPIKRLWISSLTPAGVKKGFEQLRDAKETYSYFQESNARGIADWLIGMSMSRATSILLQNHDKALRESGVFSVGRVQSALLALLKKREDEIANFQSEPFWNVLATFHMAGKEYTGKWFNEQTDRFMDQQQALQVVSDCKGKPAFIEELKKERKQTKAPMLFNLSALQTKANRVYKMTPQKVLSVAQSLYTKGFLSYPRTDSQYLTENEARALPSILKKLEQKPEYKDILPAPIQSIEQDKRYTNAKKVSDHHALIPTEQIPTNLSDDEQHIYDLVVRSVIAAFYDEAIFDHTTIITKVNSFSFVTKGKQLVQEGWRKVIFPHGEKKEEGEEEEEQTLPPLNEGETGMTKDIQAKEGKTQPPKRYSAGDLIQLMKTAGRVADFSEEEMEEEEISIKEAEKLGSIGTEATRAGIIQTLLDRKYIMFTKNKVYVLEKGKILIEALQKSQSELVSPLMTAKWEHKLVQIGEKKYSSQTFIHEVKELTTHMVEQIIKTAPSWDFTTHVQHMKEEDSLALCPKCQSAIKEYKSKKGTKFYACSGFQNGCKFIVNKSMFGKTISPTQMKKLAEKGKTDIIKGFKSKSGNTFDTFLWYNQEQDKVDLGFNHPDEKQKKEEHKPKEIGTCPKCGKPLMEHSSFIGCSGYKEGCKYAIPKTFLKKNLPSSAVKALLNGKETELIEGFVSKKGKPFKAKLKYNLEELKVEFIFN